MADTRALVTAHELAATNQAHFPNESAEYRAARNQLIIEEIELRRQVERLEKELARNKAALEVLGKASALLEMISESAD